MAQPPKKTTKERLDVLLVQRGLAATREQAQALLMAGQVLMGGQPVPKAGARVPADAPLELLSKLPYVGRGGYKLAHALDTFAIDVTGFVGLDVGASTGGFTDVMLQRGATRVYAVDVGKGQLDYRLRQDSRVVVHEGVNARNPYELPEQVDIATVDVAFISLTKVLPETARHLKPGGRIVALIKPQFEAKREEVGRGGIVRDPFVHAAVIGRVVAWCVEARFRVRNLTTSPVLGDAGNREFLVLLEPWE